MTTRKISGVFQREQPPDLPAGVTFHSPQPGQERKSWAAEVIVVLCWLGFIAAALLVGNWYGERKIKNELLDFAIASNRAAPKYIDDVQMTCITFPKSGDWCRK